MDYGHLPNTYTAPPGEWQYRVPQTGQFFRASNWPQLQEQLIAHYRATGYSAPADLFGEVEKFICMNNPDYCDSNAPAMKQAMFYLSHSFTNVLTGTKTLASWVAKGRPYVTQEQAEARATVCSSCPYNLPPEGCSGCNKSVLKDAVMLVVGKKSTSRDGQLASCRICGCVIQAKIHLPLDSITDHMPLERQHALPDHCWIVKEKHERER